MVKSTDPRISADQQADIDRLRDESFPTLRATVPAMEDLLYNPFPLLDQGFIRVIDYMGDDAAIVQAARVSYGKGTRKARGDAGLIDYLMRHKHTSPFEMCELKLHVKMPIFIARQWIRHRTSNLNEYSARYSILDKQYYLPDADYLRDVKADAKVKTTEAKTGQQDLFGAAPAAGPETVAAQSTTNKQGREGVLDEDDASGVVQLIDRESRRAYNNYIKLLNEDAQGQPVDPERQGIARELARMILPLNMYTQMYWKTDLHNLMHFIALRAHPHAQYEIRVYAETLLDILRKWVPMSAVSFENHRLNGTSLSGPAMDVIRRRLEGEEVTQEDSGLSRREWDDLQAALKN